jgi:hypothetical protein
MTNSDSRDLPPLGGDTPRRILLARQEQCAAVPLAEPWGSGDLMAHSCLWCGEAFERREGGKVQRFCSADHRREYHEAARNWALRALDDGRLTLADIRTASVATCELIEGSSAPISLSESGRGLQSTEGIGGTCGAIFGARSQMPSGPR